MEFILILVIVAVIGGVLGYFAGKKWKPRKNHLREGVSVGTILGVVIAMALDKSPVYGMSIGMIMGEVIGMLIPKDE